MRGKAQAEAKDTTRHYSHHDYYYYYHHDYSRYHYQYYGRSGLSNSQGHNQATLLPSPTVF